MKLRNSAALAAGALFLATAGVTVVATPAVAGPAPVAAVTAAESGPRGDRDYREGYRDGYKAGWNQAREECDDDRLKTLRYGNSDYAEGFDDGWGRGYGKGFREFCRYRY